MQTKKPVLPGKITDQLIVDGVALLLHLHNPLFYTESCCLIIRVFSVNDLKNNQ